MHAACVCAVCVSSSRLSAAGPAAVIREHNEEKEKNPYCCLLLLFNTKNTVERPTLGSSMLLRDGVVSACARSGRAPGSFGTPVPPREPVSIQV